MLSTNPLSGNLSEFLDETYPSKTRGMVKTAKY